MNDTVYEAAIREAIRDVVAARTPNERFDTKNALIALVDEKANGNERIRKVLMDVVKNLLDEAYMAVAV